MNQKRLIAAFAAVVGLMLCLAARPAMAQWKQTVEIDPAKDVTTDKQFTKMLADNGLKPAGFVNWYTGRWPNISFIGGMAMGNTSEDLEIFYSKPNWKWWTGVLDYVVQDGGDLYGLRATFKPYGNSPVAANRSYLLMVRVYAFQKDYQPSYILANGRRVWDSKINPMQNGWICVPFSTQEAGFPVIEFVIDKKYTPEVKGLAFRTIHLQNLTPGGIKVGLKGLDDKKEPLPGSLQTFKFGLFPSTYNFNTFTGPSIDQIKQEWKPNFIPGYPTDPMLLSPFVFTNYAGSGPYHDFMMTYGGCNVSGHDPVNAKQYESTLRGVICTPRDAAAAKAAMAKGPNVQAVWMEGEQGVLFENNKADQLAKLKEYADKLRAAKEATGAPERVVTMFEPFPPALSTANEYVRGYDMLLLKNEEDPQYNIMMSMCRGAGRTFGKPFAFYWEQTHYPYPSLDEKLNACLLYYLSGSSAIGAECENFPGFGKVVPDLAVPWVQAQRFASIHPARGQNIVPVGIFWTYGDRWWAPYNVFGEMDTFQRHVEYDNATKTLKVEPAFTQPYDWMPTDKAKWNFETTGHLSYFIDVLPELQGYNLLDVFFPEYGDAYTARITRLLTGTPYGPVDFVYGDFASAEHLKSFGVLAILGHANLEAPIVAKLQAALEAGVPVVMGAQHVKTAAGGNLWGLKLGKLEGGVYGFSGDGWKAVTSNGGKALVVSKQIGKANAYVYLGEWIKDGGAALRPLLAELGAKAAPLVFNKPDDQMEYVAYKKGAGAWVALFNHGNIVIGCDRLDPSKWRVQPPEPLFTKAKGKYTGTIEFRLDKLGLDPKGQYSLYEVTGIDGAAFEKVVAGTGTFEVKNIPFQSANGVLKATVTIDKRAEYVIAPKDKGKEVFFGK